jgi:hypothetical protein
VNSYDKGDLVRSSGAFTNTAGTATDPTTIICRVRTPTGTTTTYLYLTDAALVKDSTGNYHVDINATESGVWWVRWEGTGTVVQAEEDSFFVEYSKF